jgi:hypothetical protein
MIRILKLVGLLFAVTAASMVTPGNHRLYKMLYNFFVETPNSVLLAIIGVVFGVMVLSATNFSFKRKSPMARQFPHRYPGQR